MDERVCPYFKGNFAPLWDWNLGMLREEHTEETSFMFHFPQNLPVAEQRRCTSVLLKGNLKLFEILKTVLWSEDV